MVKLKDFYKEPRFMPFDLQCKREWEYLKSLTLQLKRKRYAIARIIEKTQSLQAMF